MCVYIISLSISYRLKTSELEIAKIRDGKNILITHRTLQELVAVRSLSRVSG